MGRNEWSGFWKTEGEAFSSIMKINTAFFARKLESHLSLKKEHLILDYGCGPGLLADILIPKKIQLIGVDINDSFIRQCNTKYPDSTFVTISTDINTTENILKDSFPETKFDYIILLSILQYFDDSTEVEKLLQMLRKYVRSSGAIILGDIIDTRTSPIRDAMSLFYWSIKGGKVISFVRFILYLIFSNYRKISSNRKLLTLSSETIYSIASRHAFTVNKVDGLTIHRTRTNYILCPKTTSPAS